ncbi:hypothetical protein Tco_1106762 [Tanacetum coccineum]
MGTRLIVESNPSQFDEIKEMKEKSGANDTSGSFPNTQRQPSSPTIAHVRENNDDLQEVYHSFSVTTDSEYRWTKDHPLTQVHGNPSKPVQTRRQLANRSVMCMVRPQREMYFISLTDYKSGKLGFDNLLADCNQADDSGYEKQKKDEDQLCSRLEAVRRIFVRICCTHKSFPNVTSSGRGGKSAFSYWSMKERGDTKFLGDKLVNWMSKKQDYTAMSSAEAKYVALSRKVVLIKPVKWLQDDRVSKGLAGIFMRYMISMAMKDMKTVDLKRDQKSM